jgi:hypothetical protein
MASIIIVIASYLRLLLVSLKKHAAITGVGRGVAVLPSPNYVWDTVGESLAHVLPNIL